MHVERTFTVDREIAHVFDFLSDFENTEKWDPGTIETRRLSGDGGVGTTYRNRSRFMKREVELEYETIGHDQAQLRSSVAAGTAAPLRQTT